MAVLENLEPKKVFEFFEEMCAIPHGSGNTRAISDYLMDFAKKRGLLAYRDDMNNVIIIKDAAPGYENADAVILQGHTDMVCEKAPDCKKDMTKEGLDLAVDGDIVFARGTTLGGDNGVGVAIALAFLDADDIPHPRLEAVFTVDEEVGMLGAVALEDLSMLKGRRMINLDSEDEGVFTVSCAGGNVTKCTLPISREDFSGEALEITAGGLAGGHSGIEINKGLANANKLLGRVLYECTKKGARLVSMSGGLKDNAIPRSASAVIVVSDIKAIEEICARFDAEFKNEYKVTDKNVFVSVKKADGGLAMTEESTKHTIAFLQAAPNGISAMSADIEGLVQTSLNIGILNTFDDRVETSFCVRSSIESQKHMLSACLEALCAALGGKTEVFGDYSGWEYKQDSPLRDLLCEVYKCQYGEMPKIEAIHAGVECGIFAGKIPGLDCVSIGPDLTEIHTCREKMSISSTARLWEMLKEVLKRMK